MKLLIRVGNMEKLFKRSKTWMILAVLIGFICCVFLCITRHQIEQQNRSFEMSMDYDAVLAMAHNDGYDTDTTVAKLKKAGLTSFAIYDTTLNKLTQRGEASLITKMGARLYYPQFNLQDQPFEYYLIGKPKDTTDLYFDEVYEDLQLRLGSKNAVLIDNPQYRIIGLHGNMPALGEVNLGILSADANQIAKNGFHGFDRRAFMWYAGHSNDRDARRRYRKKAFVGTCPLLPLLPLRYPCSSWELL